MALETRPRPPFENIALVLQGGGALGAYQAGVYEASAAADLGTLRHPEVLERPTNHEGVFTFDLVHDGRE
jgi:predicted acylesterase/phospholipase RssA